MDHQISSQAWNLQADSKIPTGPKSHGFGKGLNFQHIINGSSCTSGEKNNSLQIYNYC